MTPRHCKALRPARAALHTTAHALAAVCTSLVQQLLHGNLQIIQLAWPLNLLTSITTCHDVDMWLLLLLLHLLLLQCILRLLLLLQGIVHVLLLLLLQGILHVLVLLQGVLHLLVLQQHKLCLEHCGVLLLLLWHVLHHFASLLLPQRSLPPLLATLCQLCLVFRVCSRQQPLQLLPLLKPHAIQHLVDLPPKFLQVALSTHQGLVPLLLCESDAPVCILQDRISLLVHLLLEVSHGSSAGPECLEP